MLEFGQKLLRCTLGSPQLELVFHVASQCIRNADVVLLVQAFLHELFPLDRFQRLEGAQVGRNRRRWRRARNHANELVPVERAKGYGGAQCQDGIT